MIWTWRKRRKLSYLLTEFDDYNLPFKIEPLTSRQVISFFDNESKLIQPAKSYFVAIVYAWLLHTYFDIEFYEALNYDDLLIEDSYFVPYLKDKDMYDSIINGINLQTIPTLKSTQKTINYFKQEFLIGTNSKSNQTM